MVAASVVNVFATVEESGEVVVEAKVAVTSVVAVVSSILVVDATFVVDNGATAEDVGWVVMAKVVVA